MILTSKIMTAVQKRASQSGTRSFYLYDTSIMRAKIANLKSIMPAGVEVFYAMKANPHRAFLDAAKKAGVEGIEIASLGEATAAVAAGFAPKQLIFTGPGKSPEELEWSIANGVRTVHIESLTEAHRLNMICRAKGKKQDMLVRVNPNFHIDDAQVSFSGGSSKFGIDENRLHSDLSEILKLDHLNFRGLHVYAATGLLKVEDLLKNCELVFTMARAIEEKFKNAICDIIDFGGGFGIDYLETGKDFSPQDYAAKLQQLITQFGFGNRRFMLELGRYLGADSGWYCTEILDIKSSLGKKQIVCAGGTNHFRRPAALKINHPVVIVPMNRSPIFDAQEKVHDEQVYIGGPLCSSIDKIANDIYVKDATIGDIVVLCLAGAYGLSMSHVNFLSHEPPEEVVI